MIPFILAGRRKLPPDAAPSPSELYDPVRQLWIDSQSDEPLVSRLQQSTPASQYGETSITETREGADQSEGTLQASPYGETSITKTQEGADQTELSSILASAYGETISTRTREGTDQSEITSEVSADMRVGTHAMNAGAPDLKRFDSRIPTHAPHSHF